MYMSLHIIYQVASFGDKCFYISKVDFIWRGDHHASPVIKLPSHAALGAA